MKILSEYSLGDMSVRYVLAEDGQVGMELYPASMKPFIKEGRRYQVDPLVQWKKEGDAFPYGFANGMTMRNSETVSRMEYKEQKVEQSEEGICVTTVLEDALGSEILHILRYKNGDPALWVSTGIRNCCGWPFCCWGTFWAFGASWRDWRSCCWTCAGRRASACRCWRRCRPTMDAWRGGTFSQEQAGRAWQKAKLWCRICPAATIRSGAKGKPGSASGVLVPTGRG